MMLPLLVIIQRQIPQARLRGVRARWQVMTGRTTASMQPHGVVLSLVELDLKQLEPMLRPGVKKQLPAVITTQLLLVTRQRLVEEVQLPGAERRRRPEDILQHLETTVKQPSQALLPGADIMITTLKTIKAELPAGKLPRHLA